MRLEHHSWMQIQEYFEKKDIVIVPLGSVENHGSHLGLGTDFIIPDKIVELLESKVDILSIPVMPFGMADHHMNFPGTLSIGHDGLFLIMTKIIEQLFNYGARKIIFLNGHGGNTPVLNRIALNMNKKGAICAIIDWWTLAGQINPNWKGGHAGAQETSAMLYINPDYVHMDYAKEFHAQNLSDELVYAGANEVLCNGIPISVPRSVEKLSTSGWYGTDNIKTSTAEWGKEMLESTVDYVADFILKFEKVKL